MAFQVVIIIAVHGTSAVELYFVCCLTGAYPFKEVLEIRLCHLSTQLPCLSHLTQHGFNLLPLLRLGELDRVEPGSCLLVQNLTQYAILHILHLLHFLLLLLLSVTPSSLHRLHLCHPSLPDLSQLIVAHLSCRSESSNKSL